MLYILIDLIDYLSSIKGTFKFIIFIGKTNRYDAIINKNAFE